MNTTELSELATLLEKAAAELRKVIKNQGENLGPATTNRFVSVMDVGFSIRATRKLQMTNLDTLGQIADRTREQFMDLTGANEYTANEVSKKLALYGLAFAKLSESEQ